MSVRPAIELREQPSADFKIIELSPEQFAAISPATAGPTGTPHPQSMTTPSPKLPEPDNSVKGRLSRIFKTFTGHPK